MSFEPSSSPNKQNKVTRYLYYQLTWNLWKSSKCPEGFLYQRVFIGPAYCSSPFFPPVESLGKPPLSHFYCLFKILFHYVCISILRDPILCRSSLSFLWDHPVYSQYSRSIDLFKRRLIKSTGNNRQTSSIRGMTHTFFLTAFNNSQSIIT